MSYSDEKETTTKKIEELSNECSYLQSQLVEAQAARVRVEGERKELETKTTEERVEHDTTVQRLEAEVASKQEDIQAKDKLIQKVRKLWWHPLSAPLEGEILEILWQVARQVASLPIAKLKSSLQLVYGHCQLSVYCATSNHAY